MSEIMTDPFAADGFSLAELTVATNKLPNNPRLIQDSGIFADQGVTTRSILVEEQNGILNLLPSVPPGGPATVGNVGKRKLRSFVIPHIPHDDVVLPSDVQGVRAFGSASLADTQNRLLLQKVQTMRDKHGITLEWMRVGAMKGILVDGDAATILYNFYDQFGITAKTVDFALDDEDTEVRSKCLEVKRHIETHLFSEVSSGVRAYVSPDFYDALTQHTQVKEAFKFYDANQQNLAADMRSGFRFGDIEFIEYNGSATTPDGTVNKFIADGEGHAFPLGSASTFKTFYAPADFNETVNTIGLPVYAKMEPRKFGRGWDLHTQSNPFPICLRPEVLVKLTQ